ncbi:hypothetical protein ENBRE01_3394, partial [Enteropsectra breve]
KEHYKDVQLLIFVSRDVNLIKSLTAKQRQKILASNVFRYCYKDVIKYLSTNDEISPAVYLLFAEIYEQLPKNEEVRCFFSSKFLKDAKIHQVKDNEYIFEIFKKLVKSSTPCENVMGFLMSVSEKQRFFLNNEIIKILISELRYSRFDMCEFTSKMQGYKKWLVNAYSNFDYAETCEPSGICLITLKELTERIEWSPLSAIMQHGEQLYNELTKNYKAELDIITKHNCYVSLAILKLIRHRLSMQ